MKIEASIAKPEFRALAEVPLLCTLLVHILLRRGAAGAAEMLQYICREVQRKFDEDISGVLEDLLQPLEGSRELYSNARNKLQSSDPNTFKELLKVQAWR